ncbi:hypothetical protein HYC85_001301 [Camellia sinensis]|uniref:Uncharacterized protein n=1 Tax=Camellia sinensis TaxID=4442 RepID=A0A7J7I502_CAMSI|nr:hypothetical protein HYC85_001301 [Camellia sinensis]
MAQKHANYAKFNLKLKINSYYLLSGWKTCWNRLLKGVVLGDSTRSYDTASNRCLPHKHVVIEFVLTSRHEFRRADSCLLSSRRWRSEEDTNETSKEWECRAPNHTHLLGFCWKLLLWASKYSLCVSSSSSSSQLISYIWKNHETCTCFRFRFASLRRRSRIFGGVRERTKRNK